MKVKLNAVTQPVHEDCKDMSIEEYLIFCAKVSSTDRIDLERAPKLMKYLIDHKHISPFEMVNMAFEITTSRAIAQQILRHRSFSFQEFSQRYSAVTGFEPLELREQAVKNRQSSTVKVTDPNILGNVEAHLMDASVLYRSLLEQGVAKESARMILPLTTETTMVMNGTLRSWIHFLDQRCDSHAQKEIQLIAFEIRNHLIDLCPWTAEALEWKKV